MDLKSRLSKLRAQTGAAATAATPKPSVSELRARIAHLEGTGARARTRSAAAATAPRAAPDTLARTLGGEQIADGVIRIRARIPLTGQLGAFALHRLRETPHLPGETADDGCRRVYIDTETTGLSGGSGTLAFLAGIATVGDETIELTQLLLTRFGGEAALLSALAGELSADDHLVSYNGKSYDLPLLLARFRMQGLSSSFDALPHTDLLHPVRRLFASRWNDCRLLTVERELLGFDRIDDLPGSEAPAAWFAWIRGGNSRDLIRVVEHNRQDIVSLAAAHSALAQAVTQPLAFNADLHALGRWLAASDDEHGARALLQAHIEQLCDNGKRLLGRLSRRAGDWRQAVALWETLAAGGCTDSMERLAKYHEHVSKDLCAAQRCCDRLPGNAEQRHRRQRISKKLHAFTNCD